jgi:7-alpha-hydroxysteroid dehydrogenase
VVILDAFRIPDHVAIVTGSGQGIGEAIAVAFAEAGADVCLAARRREPLEAVAERIRGLGRRALVTTCDITEPADQARLVRATVDELGRLDVIVTHAGSGGAPGSSFLDTTDADLEDIFHYNVTTRVQLSRLAAPHLLRSPNGSILHITSVLGRTRDRGYLISGTTNAAVSHMTRNMAADLAPRVRVNAIACGSTATPTLLTFVPAAMQEQLATATLMQRLGRPEDIAAAALFLTAPAGSWVTGKVLEIDGGQEATSLHFGLPDPVAAEGPA